MLVNNVINLARNIMNEAIHIEIDYDMINAYGTKLSKKERPVWPLENKRLGDDIRGNVITELIASAINYCYWYGHSKIKPNDCSSTKMYNVVESEVEIQQGFPSLQAPIGKNIQPIGESVISRLSRERFPLLEERAKHIRELYDVGDVFIEDLIRRCLLY